MKLLKISLFVLMLGFSNYVLALEAPKNIILDNASSDKLEISWDTSSWAELYAISYWIKPVWTWSYEHELEIVVNDEAKATIEKLDLNTNYYIAVKAYDSLENESEYSQEISFSTLGELEKLKIDSIDVVNEKKLDLSFNLNLKKDDSSVNVNIVNLEDSIEDIEILKYKFEDNVLKIFLLNDLNKSGKYSATVVSLQWEKWEKIESWVDGVIVFDVPESFEKTNDIEENIELNSAWENNTKVLGWKDIDDTDKKAIESVAKQKEDLPTTGPTETFLFLLLSFIVWALLFMSRRKTNS